MNELTHKQGYYMAVANLVRLHGGGVVAEDLLRAYGTVNFRGIDSVDKVTLRATAKEVRRKERNEQ